MSRPPPRAPKARTLAVASTWRMRDMTLPPTETAAPAESQPRRTRRGACSMRCGGTAGATYETLGRVVGLSRTAARTTGCSGSRDSGLARIVGVVHPTVFGLTAYAHARRGPSTGPRHRWPTGSPPSTKAPFVSTVTGPLGPGCRTCGVRTRKALAQERAGHRRAFPGCVASTTSVYTEILKDALLPAARDLSLAPDADRRHRPRLAGAVAARRSHVPSPTWERP